jgi:hypothetical protein
MPVKYGRAKRAAGKPTPGTFRCRSGTWKSRPLESKLAPYGASPEFQALLLLESELISYKGLYVRADNPPCQRAQQNCNIRRDYHPTLHCNPDVVLPYVTIMLTRRTASPHMLSPYRNKLFPSGNVDVGYTGLNHVCG